MLSFFPHDVLNEILDLIESVSEGFPTYFQIYISINKVCVGLGACNKDVNMFITVGPGCSKHR